MDAGHVISGAGHIGFIGWMLFGGVFDSEPLPFEVQEVAMISGEEFQAMLDAQQAPQQISDVAQPAAPEPVEDAPEIAAAPEPVETPPPPTPVESPPVETPPQEDTPPPTPEVSEQVPQTPDTPSDVVVLTPDLAARRPVPRPVERVAPEPVAAPDPQATPDDTQQEAVAPDEAGETVEEPQEATAPEEAVTETVTEATEAPAASPTQSKRPPSRRPEAPKPQVAETTRPSQNDASETDDAVRAALEAAQSSAETPVPTGPPLSQGEKEALRVGVSNCWNVGSLSTEALATTVVVTVQMTQNAKPVNASIKMIGKSGGSDTAAKQAFEAARRAIIRCGAKGFNLPADKYGQWQIIEMTFDPTRMRIK